MASQPTKPTFKTVKGNARHAALYDELIAVLVKHSKHLSAIEILAVAVNDGREIDCLARPAHDDNRNGFAGRFGEHRAGQ